MGDISDELGEDFDATVENTGGDFQPLPAGWYSATVETIDIKPTKANNGTLATTKLSVLDSPFVNRKLFARMNLKNANPKAQEAGRRLFAALSCACGVAHPKDTTELLDKVVMVKVKIEQQEGRDPDNKVIAFKGIDGAEAKATPPAAATPAPAAKPTQTAAPAKAPAASPAATGAAKKMPWQK
jgi:pyruvate/2-oxoglutarate dehydrogenase complex dihydrolipoamide acyltransferase (E2) component